MEKTSGSAILFPFHPFVNSGEVFLDCATDTLVDGCFGGDKYSCFGSMSVSCIEGGFICVHLFIGFLKHIINGIRSVRGIAVPDRTFVFGFGDILSDAFDECFYIIFRCPSANDHEFVSADPVYGLS